MQINLGRLSNNETVLKDIIEMPVLFVVYNYTRQWNSFIEQFFKTNSEPLAKNECSIFRIISRYQITDSLGNVAFTHIKELEKFLSLRMRKKETTSKKNSIVVLIDNLFQLKIFDNKKTVQLFLKLLFKGVQFNIYLLIGTIGLYRDLLKELMAIAQTDTAFVTSTSFNELVINDDDLIFFRQKDTANFERYF